MGRQVLAVYDLILGSTTKKADLNELHLYGASRLGMIENPVSLWNNGAVSYTPANPALHTSGEMRYEITNYLGNVNAVVSDRKMAAANYQRNTFASTTESWVGSNATVSATGGMLKVVATATTNNTNKTFTTVLNKRYFLRILSDKGTAAALRVSGTGITTTNLVNLQTTVVLFTATGTSTNIAISPTTSGTFTYNIDQVELVEDHLCDAVVKMTSDYYPFGMQMPGRNATASGYRYGYNGMEKDDETKGLSGSSYTTEFRQYDPRLGRWASLDPMMMQFPSVSPYCAFDNNPIYFTDPLGLAAEGGPEDEVVVREGSRKGDRKFREGYVRNKKDVKAGTKVIFEYPDDKKSSKFIFTYDPEKGENGGWDIVQEWSTSEKQDDHWTNKDWISDKRELESSDLANEELKTTEGSNKTQGGDDLTKDPPKDETPPPTDKKPPTKRTTINVPPPPECFGYTAPRGINIVANYTPDTWTLSNPKQTQGWLKGLSKTMLNNPGSLLTLVYNMRIPGGNWNSINGGPTGETNKTIGLNRALTIKRMLINLGVPSSQIVTFRGDVETGLNVEGSIQQRVRVPCP